MMIIRVDFVKIENIKDLDKVMAGKKFDIVYSNPPYNKNLDLKNNFVDSTWRAKRKNDGERLCWSFSTEKDRLNFAKYLNTKIVRFISSLIKISQNYDMTYVPWLDFTQEWNDAKLCKEFGISEELWNYIDNFIPDYYDDYKSGFCKNRKY